MIKIINYNEYEEAKQFISLQIIKLQAQQDEVTILDWDDNQEIGLDFLQINLFAPKKIFVVWNCDFLCNAGAFQSNLEFFTILNQVSNTFEIFLLTDKKILVNKEFKEATKTWKVDKLKVMNDEDKKNIITNILNSKKLIVTKEVYAQLLRNINCDYGNITNEVNKLSLLSTTEKNQNVLIESINNYNDENIFDLFEAIIMKRSNRVWEIYYDLTKNKIDEISLINTIATQVINLYYVLKLFNEGRSINEIYSITGISVYVINIYKNKFITYNINILLDMIINLYDLEISIKLSKIDKVIGFKQFIVNSIK